MLRMTALMTLAASLTLVFAYLQLIGESPFSSRPARHLRAMKERTARPATVRPVPFGAFRALPLDTPIEHYARLERRAVSLDGYVADMVRSSDGDIHLEITAIPRAPGDRETLYVTGEVTPAFQRSEGWSFERLRQAFRPAGGSGPRFDRPTARVRIAGWLLYDWQYDGVPDRDPLRELWNRVRPTHRRTPRRVKPTPIWPRVSGWEIHPVTAIEVWDDAAGSFRRLAP